MLLCSDEFWSEWAEELLEVDPSLERVPYRSDGDMEAGDLADVTMAFFTPDLRPAGGAAFMETCTRCPNLEWLQTDVAGLDKPVFIQLLERGVRISTGSGTTAPAIAQTVMLYLLALSRDLPRFARAQQQHLWAPAASRDLEGMHLGIVGFGAIGHEVARLAEALAMEVIGLRRTPAPDDPVTTWTDDRFDDLLGWADAVVNCAPLTERTRGLFDAAAFARMRPGAWFVNVGRGQVVDEDALIAALADGHLGGAALDVFSIEPLPGSSPLWDMANVIITPHSSANTASTRRRAVELTMENFRRLRSGRPLINLVVGA